MKVISRKNLPTTPPIWPTITLGLLMDRLHAPAWLWGMAETLVLIVWIVAVVVMSQEESVDILIFRGERE